MFKANQLRAVLALNQMTLADFARQAEVSTNTLRLVVAGYKASTETRSRLEKAFASLDTGGLKVTDGRRGE